MIRRSYCVKCSNHVINPEIPERMCNHNWCQTALCESKSGLAAFEIWCLAAPLWIEGHVDGVPFYFRLRHERWRIEALGSSGRERGIHVADGVEQEIRDDDSPLWLNSFALIEMTMKDWIWQQGRFLRHGE
jgi:hypothetical protein